MIHHIIVGPSLPATFYYLIPEQKPLDNEGHARVVNHARRVRQRLAVIGPAQEYEADSVRACAEKGARKPAALEIAPVDHYPHRAGGLAEDVGAHNLEAGVDFVQPSIQRQLLVVGEEDEAGLPLHGNLEDILVHADEGSNGGEELHRDAVVEVALEAAESSEDGVGGGGGFVAGVLERLVGDEQRRGATDEVDEVHGVDAGGVVFGGCGGVQEAEQSGDALLPVDAGDDAELGVGLGVLDGAPGVGEGGPRTVRHDLRKRRDDEDIQ
ncbi:hypothetical protein ACLOJK_031419 [Asimina triloba]